VTGFDHTALTVFWSARALFKVSAFLGAFWGLCSCRLVPCPFKFLFSFWCQAPSGERPFGYPKRTLSGSRVEAFLLVPQISEIVALTLFGKFKATVLVIWGINKKASRPPGNHSCLGVQAASPRTKTHRKGWGAKPPPPFPGGFGAGRGCLDRTSGRFPGPVGGFVLLIYRYWHRAGQHRHLIEVFVPAVFKVVFYLCLGSPPPGGSGGGSGLPLPQDN
jgi:hypothetical protein